MEGFSGLFRGLGGSASGQRAAARTGRDRDGSTSGAGQRCGDLCRHGAVAPFLAAAGRHSEPRNVLAGGALDPGQLHRDWVHSRFKRRGAKVLIVLGAGMHRRHAPGLVECFQHLMPTLGGSDDRLRVGLPDERLGLFIVCLNEGVDRLLEVDERMEHAALEPPAGELGEEALDGIQPSKARRPLIRSLQESGPAGPGGSTRWA
jgi:hypothetical protein